jgi:DNA processing protein
VTSQEVARLRLNAAGGASVLAKRKILAAFAEDCFKADDKEWAQAAEIALEAAKNLRAQALAFNVESELKDCARLGVSLVFEGHPAYPHLLAEIIDPPLLFYARGKIGVPRDGIALVGSRQAGSYGLRMARRLAGEAVARGLCVVSGLARGIDGAAHKAALDAGGATWAVLGCGLSRVYPPEHHALADRIVSSEGMLISEFPLGAEPRPWNFPMRNRLISGLSWATIVVEGRPASGSLITARLALEQGRAVGAVPGPADSPLSLAPHELLRNGARLVLSLEDIMEDLPPSLYKESCDKKDAPARRITPPLSSEEEKIIALIGMESASLEELCSGSGLDFGRLSTIIFELELRGLIVSLPGQRYGINEKDKAGRQIQACR